MLSTLLGIPLGLLLLTKVAEPVVKAVLGSIIVAFSLYSLLSKRTHVLADDRLAWFFGFSAGVLGGAYSMNGPRSRSTVPYVAGLRGSSAQLCGDTFFLPACWSCTATGWQDSGLRRSPGITCYRYPLLSSRCLSEGW